MRCLFMSQSNTKRQWKMRGAIARRLINSSVAKFIACQHFAFAWACVWQMSCPQNANYRAKCKFLFELFFLALIKPESKHISLDVTHIYNSVEWTKRNQNWINGEPTIKYPHRHMAKKCLLFTIYCRTIFLVEARGFSETFEFLLLPNLIKMSCKMLWR